MEEECEDPDAREPAGSLLESDGHAEAQPSGQPTEALALSKRQQGNQRDEAEHRLIDAGVRSREDPEWPAPDRHDDSPGEKPRASTASPPGEPRYRQCERRLHGDQRKPDDQQVLPEETEQPAVQQEGPGAVVVVEVSVGYRALGDA